MCCAKCNGTGIIGGHSHTQLVDPIAPCHFRQQREVGNRVFTGRRNTHQSGYRQPQAIATLGDKCVNLVRIDARFLIFFAGVDL